jgi:type VI secretion system secreted protein Hcp
MPYHAYLSLDGAKSNSKGGPVHEMKYGPMAITPRNLGSALFQIKSQYDAGSGSLVGRRKHSPLTIVREVDSASPLLWQALCTNEALKSVDISLVGRPPSGSGEEVVSRITLTNATISKVNRYTPLTPPPRHGGHPQQINTNELERFDFTFQKIVYSDIRHSKSTSDDWLAGG